VAEQAVAAASREVPVFFPAGRQQLFGVLTFPSGRSRGVGVVVLVGGAYIPATNRNRLSVHMARRLASQGYHVLRFDYNGVGESTGPTGEYWLDRPFVEDLEGALAVLRDVGMRRLVLIGSCFGSRTILAMADRVPDLVTTILMATPIRDFQMGDNLATKVAQEKSLGELIRLGLRRRTLRSLIAPADLKSGLRMRHILRRTMALKGRHILTRFFGDHATGNGAAATDGRMSEKFAAHLRRAVERGVPMLFLYGKSDGFYEEFVEAQRGPLRSLFESARAPLHVETVEGVLHGFTTLAVQEAAIERTMAWLDRLINP
jgi:pimeloyl-ACP methyl ester carboxylesterase